MSYPCPAAHSKVCPPRSSRTTSTSGDEGGARRRTCAGMPITDERRGSDGLASSLQTLAAMPENAYASSRERRPRACPPQKGGDSGTPAPKQIRDVGGVFPRPSAAAAARGACPGPAQAGGGGD